MKEENLIFIVSQPRSGSTYLQNLLSNNSLTNTCSEPWILLNFVSQLKPELVSTKFESETAKVAFKDYLNKNNIDFNQQQKKFILNLYNPLLNGFNYVIDKTPRYWEIINEIKELFPQAKIIILKRNPIDVAKSMIKTFELENLEHVHNYKRDLLLAPKALQKFLNNNLNNTNIYSLKYEDLIANTQKETKLLYNWLGLNFDLNVLETSNNTKFKGIYGDPFQNSDNYIAAKKAVHAKKLNKLFTHFLIGYYTYLGKDFLKEYGNYHNQSLPLKKTIVFKYFLFFTNTKSKRNIFSEMYWRLKKKIYHTIIGIL